MTATLTADGLKALVATVNEGGHWDGYDQFPVSDWKMEVQDDETRLGYKDWVLSQIEHALDSLDD